MTADLSRSSIASWQFEAVGKKPGVANALGSMSMIHLAAGKHAEALETAERATVIARQIGSREYIWKTRVTAGRAYRSLNQLAQARQAFEESITTIEALRAESGKSNRPARPS